MQIKSPEGLKRLGATFKKVVMMTIGKFKEIIKDSPDDTLIGVFLDHENALDPNLKVIVAACDTPITIPGVKDKPGMIVIHPCSCINREPEQIRMQTQGN